MLPIFLKMEKKNNRTENGMALENRKRHTENMYLKQKKIKQNK